VPLSLGAQLGEKGWEAGAVVPQAMVPVLTPYMTRVGQLPPDVATSDWLAVVSQTCDVVQDTLEREPLVEVLHCRPIEALRRQFQGRKSTRRLDFRPDKINHEAVTVSAHAIADRYVVPRERFIDHEPDPNRRLSQSAVHNLQFWYALRYTRPAWPDALVRRLNEQSSRLVDAVKQLPIDDVEVRVAITEWDIEVADGRDYHLAVFFVVDQVVWDANPEIRGAVNEAYGAFVSALAECNGVHVNEEVSGVRSGDEFSWQQTKLSDEWNFANLSHQD